ncbi:hypothetical protein BGZ58_002220 [Dissophora ornata]|nr:hypothetical protein BGZ58_002220 [Dissophora ornata]
MFLLIGRQDEIESTESTPISGGLDPHPEPAAIGGTGSALKAPPESESNMSDPDTTVALPQPSANATSNINTNNTINLNSTIDPRLPASRLTMIQPIFSQVNPPLYAIGNSIVFEWAFDNKTLVFDPVNLTVDATLNSDPTRVWPIANISGTTTTVSWDTAGAKNPVLFMGFYTL